MELRQAQQSALVRQDEITQLHRDNERVLSESRALSKELNQASDQQHKLSNLNERLTAQLNQQESERTLLQERLRVATQESQALKKRKPGP
jgi:predicted  nucleic acid-binding Zn-ribbon protein